MLSTVMQFPLSSIGKPGRSGVRPGFTLVEMIVCVSIIALLISLLIPAFQKSRVVTRIVLCESNMKQQGIMMAQYASDCNDYIPQPVTTHGIMANAYYGSADLVAVTSNDPSYMQSNCLEYMANPYPLCRDQPIGAGWFYFMGYLPPVIGASNTAWKLPVFSCPDSPYIGRYFGPYTAGANSRNEFVTVTGTLSSGNYTGLGLFVGNPDGGTNYDCLPSFRMDYYFRGWAMTSTRTAVRRASNWQSTNASAVDYESVDMFAPGSNAQSPDSMWYWKVHGSGLNILFMDGHAKFGGQNLVIPSLASAGAQPPHAYYTVVAEGRPLSQAMSPGYGGCTGWPYAGQSSYAAVWNYYETGIP